MTRRLNLAKALLLLQVLCILGCHEDLSPSLHRLDTGHGDPNQWVPSGQAMQGLTPRASDLLGPQCTLMRFEWFYLEEDLAALSPDELAALRERVTECFGAAECGKQRILYGLLATTPEPERAALLDSAEVWSVPRAGHALRPETLAPLAPEVRWPAVQVAEVCPDFEAYLGPHRPWGSLSSAAWFSLLAAVRDAHAEPPSCERLFSASAPPVLPGGPGLTGKGPCLPF